MFPPDGDPTDEELQAEAARVLEMKDDELMDWLEAQGVDTSAEADRVRKLIGDAVLASVGRWTESDVDELSGKEIVVLMQAKGQAISRARTMFSSECGRIEQAMAQRKPPSIVEIRRMEFKAVIRIFRAAGVFIKNTTL